MKFTEAWANVLFANSILKISTAVLGVLTTILTFSTIRLALRDPLIIDRECFSKTVASSKAPHTPMEIETFSRIALEKRFNSEVLESRGFVSVEELANRKKEQEEFKSKGIIQKILVNKVNIEGTKVKVDTDRVFASGKIKTIIPFPILLELIEADRTESNPYGLMLGKVSLVKEREEKP